MTLFYTFCFVFWDKIMRKVLMMLISFTFLIAVPYVWAISYPNPTGYVNDYANIYSQSFKSELDTNLSNFEKTTGNEIAVVAIQSLEGEPIEDYTVKLFEKWKIGKKGSDNGLLFLIAVEDREMRFEVGYGLEPYITDGRAGEIIRNIISPEFKKGNYEGGTRAGITEVERILTAKEIAPTAEPVSQSGKSVGSFFVYMLIALFFVGPYIAAYLGRSKEIWPGGAIGGVIGAAMGFLLGSVIIGIITLIGFGLFGLFMDLVLTKTYQNRKDKGLPTDWWRSGGGFFGGGGFGGGRSGGGFGGFGGGGSGGGGASGRW